MKNPQQISQRDEWNQTFTANRLHQRKPTLPLPENKVGSEVSVYELTPGPRRGEGGD